MMTKVNSNGSLNKRDEKVILFIILFSALVLRMILAVTNKGLDTDINCFKAWANVAATNGLGEFYRSKMFVDYPPGYIYILYFIGKIQKIFALSWDSGTMLLILKLPAIIADLACSYIIYLLSKKKLQSGISLLLCLFYSLNPAVIFNSAVWGQIDGFFTLFIVLMLLYTVEKRLIAASLTFVIALLIKPQALIFTPILLFAFWEKKDLKLFAKCIGYSFIFLVVLILPYSLKQHPTWIIERYVSTLSSYPYSSLNAFNLYCFFGDNCIPDTTKFFFMPYKIWGMLFIVFTVAFSAYVFLKSKLKFKLTYIALFIITSVFILSTKMHERYMFPAIMLSILWYIFSRDRRAIYVSAVLSLTNFINVAAVYNSAQHGVIYIPSNSTLMVMTSGMNILAIIYIIKIGYDYCTNKKLPVNNLRTENKYSKNDKIIREQEEKIEAKEIIKEKVTFVRKDYILIGILVVLYSVVAFVNLGSTKVPKSFWKPTTVGESFYVDFGQEKQLNKISYYCGLGEGVYNLEFSDDAKVWRDPVQINQTSIYVWLSINLNQKARYVKVSVSKPDGMLNEMAFWEANNKKPINIKNVTPISIDSKDSGNPNLVFNEQNIVSADNSYLTGMIFDEIYHARTAYEQLHLLGMFEWTHPPLGKLIIAVGVALFGMDPFGWRVMGTLFGIGMIPIMYFFGKRLFKKAEYAFLAAFLMTFDFMHFTQTRIATVDVFGVFFIMLMYYFMFKFIDTDVNREGNKKALIAFALSGISFALAVATKWIGIYGGAGLAILFIKEIMDRYKEYKSAQVALKKQNPRGDSYKINRSIVMNFADIQIKTVIAGVIFFIIVPVIVYICSYIPFMMIPGPGHTFADVIRFQGYMYHYHSTLVATHPFESPWWQWPIIEKPMWYYSGQSFLPAGKISSIVCMGNPAIWWVGIPAALATLIIGIKKKDKVAFVILLGGLSEYLPWVLVTRLTFIYHYFAAVPFVMLCIVYVIAYLNEKYAKTKYYVYGYMGLVVILFIMFYPVISGMVIDKSFAQHYLKWFSTWFFYS
ncbi:MAG: glycosyltransferase family 39 protein [Bacillota bacterium]|nr:glycosyltransferase family 39 protein [Bacillota bacterium]